MKNERNYDSKPVSVEHTDHPTKSGFDMAALPPKEKAVLEQADAASTAAQIAELRESFAETKIVADELKKIAANPALQEQYTTIIEHGDTTALREKSQRQLADLKTRYLGKLSLFTLRERFKLQAKLKEFQTMVDALNPVRADSATHDEYLSPEHTGIVSSYGPQDTIVKAERYVYASFDGIGHHMSKGEHARPLDETDLSPRAEIVMMDVADLMARASRNGSSFAEHYINNMFDYNTGKELLAVYLASVFNTPQQAKDMLDSTSRNTVQHWDADLSQLHYRDSTAEINSTAEVQAQDKRDEELTAVFLDRMKQLLADTGIEPPLALEVRIPDRAKVLAL